MPTFRRRDVVKVPFPYTDRATRQSRPALVVSTADATKLGRISATALKQVSSENGRVTGLA